MLHAIVKGPQFFRVILFYFYKSLPWWFDCNKHSHFCKPFY